MWKIVIPSYNFNIEPKSDMVICCLGVGSNHEAALKIMRPTVEYYGKIHNIDTLFFTESLVPSKLAKKNKIFLLANLLKYYETVMWMDSDTIIVDPTVNIRDELHSNYVIYMTSYFRRNPLFPNSGVIVAKRDKMTIEILEKVWNFKRKNGRGWWDQQAFLNLLGYKNRLVKVLGYNGPTKYTPYIGALDVKWNSRPNRKDTSKNPIIMHHCGMKFSKRLYRMKKSYQQFLKNISKNN
ncbi:hypothetical protein CJ195_09025 [Bacillus sp. UMB0899]|nr:hypothetical protein CJ195_09025 [Bacillus sp. UMB0899]